HVLTALIAVTLAFAWLGGLRSGNQREPALAPAPGADRGALTGPARPPGGNYTLPNVKPPELPADVLKRSDADEQINIRVYAAVNRGVVNITTASEGGGLYGDEISAGSGSGF